MYIITALMTIPVAIAGIFIWPGTPSRPNTLFLTQEELALARKRLDKTDSDDDEVSSERSLRLQKPVLAVFGAVLLDWKVYVLTFWDILFWNSGSSGYGGYLLWLKSLKRYSTPKLNQLSATSPALGIFYVLFI